MLNCLYFFHYYYCYHYYPLYARRVRLQCGFSASINASSFSSDRGNGEKQTLVEFSSIGLVSFLAILYFPARDLVMHGLSWGIVASGLP